MLENNLDRKSPIPLYAQLEAILREKIEGGVWKENQIIPSENDLSRTYGISRMTARSVINQLVQEGLLYRIQGKGTFVSSDRVLSQPFFTMGITDQLRAMGYQITTRLIDISVVEATPALMADFGCGPGATFYKLVRVREESLPVSLHTSYIPTELCPGLENNDFENEPLRQIVYNKYGLQVHHSKDDVSAVQANAYESELLGIQPGHPLLLLEGRLYDANNRLLEYARVLFCSNKIKLHYERTV